jgi:hypothetical protein
MNFLTNWKTTLLGGGAVLAAGGHLLTALGHGDMSSIVLDVTAICTGFGLLFAKDSNVTGGTTPNV